MKTILVVNAGSSSVKFEVFDAGSDGNLQRRIRGQIDGIGAGAHLRAEDHNKQLLVDQSFAPSQVGDVAAALSIAGTWLRDTQKIQLDAVGHRVVHGGPQYDSPVKIDREVLSQLERYVSLAPLHQPNNLAPIRTLLERFPDLPQVACFDTAFHRGHGAVADRYAIPESFYAEGVRRYGFHGLSYEYIAKRLHQLAPDVVKARVIVAHLGSGASMCALANGRSVECTMGFSVLDGLPMGTRSGQIDPGVLLHLIGERGMTAAAVQDLLYRDCGLKGLSGISNDMRELQSNPQPRAKLAVDYFVYRVGLHAGMLAAALGGLDAFVFTAGIGEHSATIRGRIAETLAWLGADLNGAANESGETLISRPHSKIALYVIPTDEELVIARHTWFLLSNSSRRGRAADASPYTSL